MTRKHIILASSVVVIVVVSGLLLWIARLSHGTKTSTPVKDTPPKTNIDDNASVKPSPQASTQATFSDAGLGVRFTYPSTLKVERDKNKIYISHLVDFPDPGCDMSGEQHTLPTTDDVGITLEVTTTPPGFLADEGQVLFGQRKGTYMTQGAEGCGEVIYKFDLENGETLVATKALVVNLSGIVDPSTKQQLLSAGAMTREQSDQILRDIITSLTINHSK